MKKQLPAGAILIPDNASRVFKGNIFDVYQWPQTMFDGTTKTFEMLKRPDTVLVIGVVGNKIIMIDDEQPGRATRRQFPGGRTDDTDNSWLEAAKREMLEETGYAFKNWKLLTVAQPLGKIEWFYCFFVATDAEIQQPQQVDAGGEKITIQYIDFNDLRSSVLSGEDKELNSLLSFFVQTKNLNEFLDLSSFVGTEQDR